MKKSCSDDRLSNLPDSLVFDIFSFLPIRDVVRTTKLSRRWRNLWTKSPFLNFSDYDHNFLRIEGTPEKDRNFYNRALILWRGDRLLKFKVRLIDGLSMPLVCDIKVWLRFAMEKQVKELFLDLLYPFKEEGDYSDSGAELETLYSCSSLEVLSVDGIPFLNGWNGNVKWDRLKSLTILTYHLRQDMLSKVLRGSPKLEVFVLDLYVETRGSWCFQSSSLKKLSIHKWAHTTPNERNTEMKIQAPNLETLEISGVPCGTFSMDVAPLTDVTLGLCCLYTHCDCGESEECEFVDIKGTLEKILPTIQHVESLTLSQCSLEVLVVMINKSLLSPLSNVKFLKLSTSSKHSQNFSEHLQIAGLLQNFPKLKRLVIDDENESYDDDDYQDDQELLEFEANIPNSFLLQLRTVEVTWAKCDITIFWFIEILLKYASKLEKMVFRVRGFKPPSSPPEDSLFLASQKLHRMPRSSPTALLIFCEY